MTQVSRCATCNAQVYDATLQELSFVITDADKDGELHVAVEAGTGEPWFFTNHAFTPADLPVLTGDHLVLVQHPGSCTVDGETHVCHVKKVPKP